MQNTNDSTLNTKLSAIDKALAAAKARKAIKDAVDGNPPDAEKAEKPAKAKAVTHPEFAKQQKSDALRAARDAAKAAREVERQRRREAKAAETSSKKPVHMKKVETAASKLPSLRDAAARVFEEAIANFSSDQIVALAMHLQHHNRTKATERALSQRLEPGTKVRITGGDIRFVGKFGTVEKSQRIRCYVNVPGAKRPVYLFTSEVEVLKIQDPSETQEAHSEKSAAVG